MALLDDPLDTTLGWTGAIGRKVNGLPLWARWGWTTGWGIPPILAAYWILAHGHTGGTDANGAPVTTRGVGTAMLCIWGLCVLMALARAHGWLYWFSKTRRMWLVWVIMGYVFYALIIVIVLVPNP
jgi:hypothetical protein